MKTQAKKEDCALIIETHRTYFEKLLEIIKQIDKTIAFNQGIDDLKRLSQEHKLILHRLQKMGVSKDKSLKDIVMKVEEQTKETFGKLKTYQQSLREKILTITKKRRGVKAYDMKF